MQLFSIGTRLLKVNKYLFDIHINNFNINTYLSEIIYFIIKISLDSDRNVVVYNEQSKYYCKKSID